MKRAWRPRTVCVRYQTQEVDRRNKTEQINPINFEITPQMRDSSYAPSLNLMPLFKAYDEQVRGTPPERTNMKWMNDGE